MNRRVLGALAALAILGAAACSSPQASKPALAGGNLSSPPPLLATAIKHAVHLGPAGAATQVDLSLGLKVRQPERLASLIASGQTVTPEQYAAEFGPDPFRVQTALAALRSGGLGATWRPGSALIAAGGPAPAVAAMFRVDIEGYRLADGATFYASLDEPRLPPEIAAVVTSVTGLDNYRHQRTYAVRPGGLTPTDVLAFYDLKALRDSGLDGSGITIVLPEIDDLPNFADLDKFATKYGLPPFEPLLTLKRDPSWGTPMKPQGEAVLDLEIIHEVAPAAKMVVYFSAPDFAHGDRAFDQMVSDHLGSIISESLGACEPDTPSGHRSEYASIQDRSVAQGMSHFIASGDSGAYTCGVDSPPAGSFPSTLPNVTSVGGTTVFESVQGIYFKEAAWGGPIDESGTGGGSSQFYPIPDYQKIVGQAAGHGFRQVPDVAADADPNSGFNIIFGGQEGEAGGTSAAAPLWAATVALIDQDLKRKGLRETGFANPAIYWMGANQSRLPSPPFHDVKVGNNLAYDAAAGWDFTTGWGSMDGAALDAAWILYIKGGGA
ncbi:MAG TPA: S53 family peptidase [Candidatus Dormibacteraeota bacterium]